MHSRMANVGAFVAAGLGVWAVATVPAAAKSRSASTGADTVEVIVSQSPAEDLVHVPGTDWIVASAFSGPGGMRLIDARTRKIVDYTFADDIAEAFDVKAYGTCPGPVPAQDRAAFHTHGLALGPRHGRKQTVYAVHHGARESVEVFVIDTRPKKPTFTWTGCIVAPPTVGLNSVVQVPGGGIVATNFMARGGDQAAEFKTMSSGQNNGELWEWQAASGWAKIPGSEGSGLNGVEISPDGKTLYAAAWGSRSFVRMSRTGTDRVEIPLGFRVDNVHWVPGGKLMIAGQVEAGSKVVTIDPQTLAVTVVSEFKDSPEFGEAAVAIPVRGKLWLGSYGPRNIAVVTPGRK